MDFRDGLVDVGGLGPNYAVAVGFNNALWLAKELGHDFPTLARAVSSVMAPATDVVIEWTVGDRERAGKNYTQIIRNCWLITTTAQSSRSYVDCQREERNEKLLAHLVEVDRMLEWGAAERKTTLIPVWEDGEFSIEEQRFSFCGGWRSLLGRTALLETDTLRLRPLRDLQYRQWESKSGGTEFEWLSEVSLEVYP